MYSNWRKFYKSTEIVNLLSFSKAFGQIGLFCFFSKILGNRIKLIAVLTQMGFSLRLLLGFPLCPQMVFPLRPKLAPASPTRHRRAQM